VEKEEGKLEEENQIKVLYFFISYLCSERHHTNLVLPGGLDLKSICGISRKFVCVTRRKRLVKIYGLCPPHLICDHNTAITLFIANNSQLLH